MEQEIQLQDEMNKFVRDAITGHIPVSRLCFAANKIFKREGNVVGDVRGTIAEVFSRLADVNCRLWHEQEKVYDFEKVVAVAKDAVVKQLALLNLERNMCIDQIDKQFQVKVERLCEVEDISFMP
jgi:hypothetical protein